jgi:hypothetical protein
MADRAESTTRRTPAGELLNAVESLARAGGIDEIVEIIRSTARRLVGSAGIALILAEDGLCHYIEEDAVGPLEFPLHEMSLTPDVAAAACRGGGAEPV